ncbi:hypothetical protein Tco_0710306 [Tanacetum coccineum]
MNQNRTVFDIDEKTDAFYLQKAVEYHEWLIQQEAQPRLTRTPIFRDREDAERPKTWCCQVMIPDALRSLQTAVDRSRSKSNVVKQKNYETKIRIISLQQSFYEPYLAADVEEAREED